jgi:hypothetical protein
MKLIEGRNYRQWQKRNKKYFNSLTKTQQQQARQQGYRNIGWERVQMSWQIISRFTNNVASLFEHKISKGDLVGAINLSLIEAEQAKELAQEWLKNLEQNRQQLDKLAEETLAKYPLL